MSRRYLWMSLGLVLCTSIAYAASDHRSIVKDLKPVFTKNKAVAMHAGIDGLNTSSEKGSKSLSTKVNEIFPEHEVSSQLSGIRQINKTSAITQSKGVTLSGNMHLESHTVSRLKSDLSKKSLLISDDTLFELKPHVERTEKTRELLKR